MVVGPWISYLEIIKKSGDTDMGDIEFLCIKEFDGKIIRIQGDLSTLTDTLTHTATAGKDAYVLVAKIIPSGFTVAAATTSLTVLRSNNSTEAKISLNLVEKDRVTVGMGTSAIRMPEVTSEGGNGSGYGTLTDGNFYAAIGSKVSAGQIIEIENTLDNGNCIAQMVILEEDTGVSPQIPSI